MISGLGLLQPKIMATPMLVMQQHLKQLLRARYISVVFLQILIPVKRLLLSKSEITSLPPQLPNSYFFSGLKRDCDMLFWVK